MPRTSQTLERADVQAGGLSRIAWFNRVLLCLLGAVVSFLVLTRIPQLTTVIFPDLSRLLEYILVEGPSDIALLYRFHANTLQAVVAHAVDKSQLLSLQLAARPLNLNLKDKLMIALGVCDISVIVPTLNEEKYLPGCLKSLANQSFRGDYEVIVVDGGSTDRTVEIAGKYADRVVSESVRPVGAARNLGARMAEGEILAFIDGDTRACDGWLETMAEAFRSHPPVVGVTGPTLPYEGTRLDRIAYQVATGWIQRLSLRLGFPHVSGFNCGYRTEPFWRAGGFDEDRVLSEDIMLSMKMRHQGQIAFEDDMLAYTSLRRIKKYGYPYLTTYYLINWGLVILLGESLGYAPVR